MRREVAIGVPSLALATAGGLWVQAVQKAQAALPRFSDLCASGNYGNTEGEDLQITVLGDSSLTGPGLKLGSEIWIAQLVDHLPFNVKLRSCAKGGARVRDVLLHQAADAALTQPDLFVLAVGSNDALHSTSARLFRRDLDALLNLLCHVAPVLSLGVSDLSAIPRVPRSLRPLLAHRSATIDQVHTQVADSVGKVTRVPVRELCAARIKSCSAELFAEDRFHPNRLGHSAWAEMFEPYFLQALKQSAKISAQSADVHLASATA
ncbi:MAG: GDSL-type esterase/lipase family protein [Microthrixaceae bacterium]